MRYIFALSKAHSAFLALIGLAYLALAEQAYALIDCNNPNNPFGCVTKPTQLKGDLLTLLNNALRVIFIVAGIYAFLRFVLAGVSFINAGGDVKKISGAWNSIWQSMLGLVIIVSSFAVAALMGQILFGDYTAILNPKVYGPN